MRILVVDDDRLRQHYLAYLLPSLGHDSQCAWNGAEAVDACRNGSWPDLILMDVCMPVLDGYEATRQIRALGSQGETVPIMFLTSMQGDADLARCLECGGDDFLTMPIRKEILCAKLGALERGRQLVRRAEALERTLGGLQGRIDSELEMARLLYLNLTAADGQGDVGNLRWVTSPMALFNGDFLLRARSPQGGLRLLLGDFSGHGLAGAIGTAPVAELFYAMTGRGFSIPALVEELSRKLARLLPTGCFVACALADVEPATGTLSIWNGGLPDLLLRRAGGGTEKIESNSPPVGMFRLTAGDLQVQVVQLEPGDALYLFSDGLVECQNPEGMLFGERLEELVESGATFCRILQEVNEFRGGGEAGDDLTLAEIVHPLVLGPFERSSAGLESSLKSLLGVDSIRRADPVPGLLEHLRPYAGIEPHLPEIFTVLSELYSNAVDHGLLGLDTSLKSSPEGFSLYYQLREERLQMPLDGWVRFELTHRRTSAGGELTMVVEDSGAGFDSSLAPGRGQFGGRGINLARSLCQSLTHEGCGNRVRAIYAWSSRGKELNNQTEAPINEGQTELWALSAPAQEGALHETACQP